MIRMIQSRDASHAKAYFGDALARADYYISDQELPGYWQGRLAGRLGLAGDITKKDFFALCENRHPGTGGRLSPRVRMNRTTGYDINFHCPKSVSVLHALSGDDHLLTAFRESVTETMQSIEADSRTRVRAGGRQDDRPSGELVWAHFTHQTARPVEGFLPDPHLHSHCFVFNAAWDPAEERIKAGQFREINRDMPYYQAQFQKVLADKLVTLGYQIRQTGTSFEIEGVPQQVIDLFSKRTDQIGRVAREKGITDPKERGELGARTRAAKQKGVSMAELKEAWGRQIAALGPEEEAGIKALARLPVQGPAKDGSEVAALAPADQTLRDDFARASMQNAARDPARDATATVVVKRGAAEDHRGRQGADQGGRATAFPVPPAPALTAQQCVDYAVLHCFERASVMDGRRLLETATRRAIGVPGVPVTEIAARFQEDSRIIHVQERGRTLCTTKEVLSEERRMVELARAGQGQMHPLYTTAPEITLTGRQQRRAIEHLLTTSHRVSIVRGVAGTGKTTLMKEAADHIANAGKTVLPVAPTAQASRGVLKEAGFTEATTVAHLLADTAMQETLKGQVLWVDEAGMLGTKDMKALLELTARQNARLILSGDTRQHASVVRGDALRILNTVAGLQTAEVSTIYRQTSAQYRDAVKDLSEGEIARAFGKLDAMGCIKDVHDSSLVNDYVATLQNGKSALVISPTHAEGDAITQDIRDELRRQGKLGTKEVDVVRLRNCNLTEAERSDPRQFTPGQVVQFTQNAPGITRGSQWTVAQATATDVHITNGNGETRRLPAGTSGRYEVFDRETIPLAKGDRVRITKNGFDADGHRLNNGDLLTVTAVSQRGAIVLQNEISGSVFTIDRSFGHLAHAHCITSQASQGKAVDEVFILQPASTFPATDAKQFYVSVSRARDRAHIYTDDREGLLHHAENLRDRQSALELVGMDRHKEAIFRQQAAQDIQQVKDHTRNPERDAHEPEL